MTVRSRQETITFRHPFRIKRIDRLLTPGGYEVITDDENDFAQLGRFRPMRSAST